MLSLFVVKVDEPIESERESVYKDTSKHFLWPCSTDKRGYFGCKGVFRNVIGSSR